MEIDSKPSIHQVPPAFGLPFKRIACTPPRHVEADHGLPTPQTSNRVRDCEHDHQVLPEEDQPRVDVDTPTEQIIVDEVPAPLLPRSKLIIAVDFGTTYSTVTYVVVSPVPGSTKMQPGEIKYICNYGAEGGSNAQLNADDENVPTRLLYLGPRRSESQDAQDAGDQDDHMEILRLSASEEREIHTLFSAGHQNRKLPLKRKHCKDYDWNNSKRKCTTGRPARQAVAWGFGVQELQKNTDDMREFPGKDDIDLIKLTLGDRNLYDDADLRATRDALNARVKRMVQKKFVQDRDRLLVDYLVRLLKHTKGQLEQQLTLREMALEYVLSVPVVWSEAACRTMHSAMLKAIHVSRLQRFRADDPPDIFIVSEPEAAAQYALRNIEKHERPVQNQIFILLDAGGGTVDITTYRVTSTGNGPLRLQGEIVPPDGGLCGSALITASYLRKTQQKLQAAYPNVDVDLINEEAIKATNEWDLNSKPHISLDDPANMKLGLGQRGRVQAGGYRITWTKEDIGAVFEPSLRGTIDLLERQVRRLKENNCMASKLIVVGGFARSPALKIRIQAAVEAWHKNGIHIHAVWPGGFPGSAVAQGATIRALDKSGGPTRASRSSFGLLQHEVFGDEHENAGLMPQIDSVTGEKLVKNTISWVLDVGRVLEPEEVITTLKSSHAFEMAEQQLVCEEILYISPNKHASHYPHRHPNNHGATRISSIKINVSKFRACFPTVDKADVGGRTKRRNPKYREVVLDLVISVHGRLLKYEARWPSGAAPQQVRMREAGVVTLATSFIPGTE